MLPLLPSISVFSADLSENAPEPAIQTQIQVSPAMIPRFPFPTPDAERSLYVKSKQ